MTHNPKTLQYYLKVIKNNEVDPAMKRYLDETWEQGLRWAPEPVRTMLKDEKVCRAIMNRAYTFNDDEVNLTIERIWQIVNDLVDIFVKNYFDLSYEPHSVIVNSFRDRKNWDIRCSKRRNSTGMSGGISPNGKYLLVIPLRTVVCITLRKVYGEYVTITDNPYTQGIVTASFEDALKLSVAHEVSHVFQYAIKLLYHHVFYPEGGCPVIPGVEEHEAQADNGHKKLFCEIYSTLRRRYLPHTTTGHPYPVRSK